MVKVVQPRIYASCDSVQPPKSQGEKRCDINIIYVL